MQMPATHRGPPVGVTVAVDVGIGVRVEVAVGVGVSDGLIVRVAVPVAVGVCVTHSPVSMQLASRTNVHGVGQAFVAETAGPHMDPH